MLDTKDYKIYYHLFAVFVLSYFVIFIKLASFHMRWWDESIFAVNAYEMMHNGKYFSSYFDGAVDLYNTKPPLTQWIQIVFVKLFGYNELSLRLPSAIAASLSVLVIFKFIAKSFNYTQAWISSLILLTSSGFINFHTARTAESDALLTLFLLVGNISFIKYLIDEKKQNIIIFFIFISLAFATKLHAALLFVPAYFIILFQQKKLKQFIINWSFLGGVILFLITSVGLIYMREFDSPGYISEVLFKESSRFLTVVENHNEATNYYFENLFKSRFSIWAIFFVIGVFLIFSVKNKTKKSIFFSSLILVIVYLSVITIGSSKLSWYDMPIYPYLAIIAAYPICLLIQTIKINDKPIPKKLLILIITSLFSYPYYIMLSKSQGNTIKNEEKKLEVKERFLFNKIKKNESLDRVKIYYTGFKGSLLFYKYKLAEQNQNIKLVNTLSFELDDIVLVANDSLKKELENKYKLSVVDEYDNAWLVKLSQKP